MRSNIRFGLLSTICGIASSGLFFVLAYFSRLSPLKGGKILQAFERFGLLSKERQYFSEFREGSVFSIDDANAILWLTWLAFALALIAIALALYAETKRESTLYIGVGFLVATVSVGLRYPLTMLFMQIMGMLAFQRIRNSRSE
jgi:hypothetical protein